MIRSGTPRDQHVAPVGVPGSTDHAVPRHEQIQLRGGFSTAEWIAVGFGSGAAAIGLGVLTGSVLLGISVGIAFLAAKWAILLLI